MNIHILIVLNFKAVGMNIQTVLSKNKKEYSHRMFYFKIFGINIHIE